MEVESILQWWSFIFLGVIVYASYDQLKRFFPKLSKKFWFQRTIVFYGPLLGAGLAALPFFPMPEALGDEIGTRLMFGMVAGICSSWLYKAMMRLLGKDTKSQSERR